MTWVILLASCISAIATAFIGFYAYCSHELAKQHRQELADLYQAIVIATLISGPAGSNLNAQENCIKIFKQFYNGETEIFRDEANSNQDQ